MIATILTITCFTTSQIYAASNSESFLEVLTRAQTTGGAIYIIAPTIVLPERLMASFSQGVEIVGAPTIITWRPEAVRPGLVITGPMVHLQHVAITGPMSIRSREVVLVDVHIRSRHGNTLMISDSGPQLMVASIIGCSVLGAPGFGCFVNKNFGNLTVELRGTSIYACGWGGNSDGMQISQSGEGHLAVLVDSCSFALNAEDGLEIEESGPGDLGVRMSRVISGWNGEENLEIGEYQDGMLGAIVQDAIVFGQLPGSWNRNDGMEIRAADSGASDISLFNIEARDHAVDGLHIETEDNVRCVLRGCNIQYNDDDGLHFDCREVAELTIDGCTILNNNARPTSNDILARCRRGILTILGSRRNYGVLDINSSAWELRGIAARLR